MAKQDLFGKYRLTVHGRNVVDGKDQGTRIIIVDTTAGDYCGLFDEREVREKFEDLEAEFGGVPIQQTLTRVERLLI